MIRLAHILRASAAAAYLGLAACAYPVNGPEQAFDPNTRFPIAVEPHMMTLRLSYDANGLDNNMAAQLAHFAQDYADHGTGSISISSSVRDRDAPLDVADRLVGYGIPRDRILFGNQDGQDSAGGVKVSYIRYMAQLPPCGDWSVNQGITADNTAPPNFGCATQHNIATIVSDPRDLVSPRPLDPDDAQRRLQVLEKYRQGQATVSQKTNEQSAAVSEVGKM